jgi:pimeloyl-ACP methyl ester carboxylesterase
VTETSFAVIPGAGSAGLTWRPAAESLAARVLPLPGSGGDVFALAAELAPAVAALPEPRVLVGTSAGGMAAIEIARQVPVQALVFVAAGFGITVSESALQWLVENPPDLHQKLARICVYDRSDQERQALIVADYEACGQPAHVAQLRAVAAYRPEPLADPPATLVLWGVHDRAIPLADHVELAQRFRGALVPIAEAAHVPFLEQPEEVVKWVRRAGRLAMAG